MFKAGVQMKKFRWIHLSDIHFQTKNVSFNTQKLREKLPEFLAGLDGNFDAMIITGDFRYAPEKENNPQKVVDYINLLCEKLRWTDTPKVITVPGNHDLDRGSVRTAVIRSAKDKYQPNMGTFDPELLGQLICPLSSRQVKYLKVSDKNTYISFWSVGIFMHTISLYIF